MRIAVLTWTNRRAGGLETYLEHVIGELSGLGHTVSLWHEVSEPHSRPLVDLPGRVETYGCRGPAVAALEQWAPDVLLSNGLSDADTEAALHDVAPVVFVAHNYHGTCISGTKCWATTPRRPCHRTFGWQCLMHYYPHRCGGLSPLTMARLYRQAGQRLHTVRSCERVVTLSAHMRDEYLAHGLRDDQVVVVPYGPPAPTRHAMRPQRAGGAYRLACMGRLEALKGVDLLIDALPAVREALGVGLELLVIGDGPETSSLKSRADRLQRTDPLIGVTFTGWQSPAQRDESLAATDLFVMPSVWPEPFGLAGLEAAHLGVPAVAFDVGGVADWLIDGETGRLATGAVPSSASLAGAIVDCLQSPNRHAMGLRASTLAAQRSPRRHATALAGVLALAIDSRRTKARAH